MNTAVERDAPVPDGRGMVVLHVASAFEGHNWDHVEVWSETEKRVYDLHRELVRDTATPEYPDTALMIGALPTGTYRLNALKDTETTGNTRTTYTAPVGERLGRFKVEAARVTDLGTVLYYPENWYFSMGDFQLIRLPANADTRRSLQYKNPVAYAAAGKQPALGWLDERGVFPAATLALRGGSCCRGSIGARPNHRFHIGQDMPVSRRQFLVAGAIAPFLSACATDLAAFSDEPLPALAARRGVCAASYVTLEAGRPGAPVVVSGCPSTHPFPGDAIFQAASLTKPVMAFLALNLARDGTLDLSAPVSRYLPEGYMHRQDPFGGREARRADHVPATTLARIPVATLLNHTSGLPNWTEGELAPEFAPGERWQYSGEGYLLLQAVIGAVTGQEIESCVSTHLFDRLGMRSSRLRLTEEIRHRLVPGTSWFGWGRQFDFVEPNGAASLYTTAEDYAKLLSALLTDGALLSLTLSAPVTADAELGLAWGYGWGIETAAGGPYLWQWGNNPGYRAFAMVSAASGNGFVLLTNSERGMPLAAGLARSTLPAEHRVFRSRLLG